VDKTRREEQALQDRTKCSDAEKYFVVALDRDGVPGQDIVLKTKVEGSTPECKYVVAEGDFELKNEDPQYFKALGSNALVTDVGTGPSGRSLRIYDLGDKSLVTEKKYFGEFSVADDKLTYFGQAKKAAKDCKDVSTVEKVVDLKTFLVKETKNTKCVAEQ
jgi:hypothetical protein